MTAAEDIRRVGPNPPYATCLLQDAATTGCTTVHAILTHRDGHGAVARRALCKTLVERGWTPDAIERFYGLPPGWGGARLPISKNGPPARTVLRAGEAMPVGSHSRPLTPGAISKASVATAPAWPTAVGQTVKDGDAPWRVASNEEANALAARNALRERQRDAGRKGGLAKAENKRRAAEALAKAQFDANACAPGAPPFGALLFDELGRPLPRFDAPDADAGRHDRVPLPGFSAGYQRMPVVMGRPLAEMTTATIPTCGYPSTIGYGDDRCESLALGPNVNGIPACMWHASREGMASARKQAAVAVRAWASRFAAVKEAPELSGLFEEIERLDDAGGYAPGGARRAAE